MWSTKLLKKKFFEYFEKNRHIVLPSSSVIPKNDPTLLFTNSGMVQFKNIFMGEHTSYKRVVTSQNCIRAGGKHNDLEDVGKDNYHHTYFEMLGNWSFGDYFKKEAIEFAYKFLVEELKLDKNRLYVTYYEELDKESAEIWSKYLDKSRIISASMKDNFWEMGEFGPCGPCTEIHYDRIGNRNAAHLVNKDDPDVLEIWNVVFMEYERTPKGLKELKTKNIDTGIGLERLLSILMDVRSNYLIDSFQHIIKFIEERTNFKYEDGISKEDVAFRVLSDHARTMAVCLNDKVDFSSDGVGYVLRRILRRAVRYAHDILKLKVGDLSKIVKYAADFMEFNINESIIDVEEQLFIKTLFKGKIRLNQMVKEKGSLSGEDVFILYDTYGFPKDLTELIAREENIPISLSGFEEAKNKAKESSRKTKPIITINFDFSKTDDSFKYLECNGMEANLMGAILNNEINFDISKNVECALVFDKTCFYGESGGQVGDKGKIEFLENSEVVGVFNVNDTQIQRGYVLHMGMLESGRITKIAKLTYADHLRSLIAANHSSIHILNYFLRTFIETHQRGSLVDSEKFRLDFEGKKLSDEILNELEDKINKFVESNANVTVTTHPREEILADKTIIKMDDEEYPPIVRLITMSNDELTIKEICGGTHVKNTSEIKAVRLISETGSKLNIRRIVAVSNEKAKLVDENGKELLEKLQTGIPVVLNCDLSIKDRQRIDELNKKNSIKIAAENKRILKSVTDDLKDKLNNLKLSEEPRKKVFSYDANQLLKLGNKDLKKNMVSLSSVLVPEKVNGFIYCENNDEIFVVGSCANKDTSSSLCQDYDFRIIKDTYQGTIRSAAFDLNKFSKYFEG